MLWQYEPIITRAHIPTQKKWKTFFNIDFPYQKAKWLACGERDSRASNIYIYISLNFLFLIACRVSTREKRSLLWMIVKKKKKELKAIYEYY